MRVYPATRRTPLFHERTQLLPVLVENLAAGLTWDFDVTMISVRVRDAGLSAAGDRGFLACVAGAVFRVQGRGDTRAPA
jgi:hypothetical protein